MRLYLHTFIKKRVPLGALTGRFVSIEKRYGISIKRNEKNLINFLDVRQSDLFSRGPRGQNTEKIGKEFEKRVLGCGGLNWLYNPFSIY